MFVISFYFWCCQPNTILNLYQLILQHYIYQRPHLNSISGKSLWMPNKIFLIVIRWTIIVTWLDQKICFALSQNIKTCFNNFFPKIYKFLKLQNFFHYNFGSQSKNQCINETTYEIYTPVSMFGATRDIWKKWSKIGRNGSVI